MDSEGRMPLFMRFPKMHGKEPKFAINRVRLSLDEWDEVSRLPKEPSLRLRVEDELLRIKRDLYHLIEYDKKEITYSILKDVVKDKKPSDPLDSLFLDHYMEYLSKKEKNGLIGPSTMRSHITTMTALNEFDKNLRLKDIDETKIREFIAFLRNRKIKKGQDASKLTFGNRLIQIRAILRYIAAKGIAVKNPFDSHDIYIAPCNRNETYLNEVELSKMVNLFIEDNLAVSDRRILMLFLLACSSGLRISDTRALCWRNINFDCKNGVMEFYCIKCRRMNYVPLSPMALDLLCHLPEGDINNVEKELNVSVRVYSPTKINLTVKKLAKMVGISKNITFHAGRRTFTTLCYMNDVPEKIIESSLGHKPKNVTDRYRQWNVYEADKAAKRLSFLDMKTFKKFA